MGLSGTLSVFADSPFAQSHMYTVSSIVEHASVDPHHPCMLPTSHMGRVVDFYVTALNLSLCPLDVFHRSLHSLVVVPDSTPYTVASHIYTHSVHL